VMASGRTAPMGHQELSGTDPEDIQRDIFFTTTGKSVKEE